MIVNTVLKLLNSPSRKTRAMVKKVLEDNTPYTKEELLELLIVIARTGRLLPLKMFLKKYIRNTDYEYEILKNVLSDWDYRFYKSQKKGDMYLHEKIRRNLFENNITRSSMLQEPYMKYMENVNKMKLYPTESHLLKNVKTINKLYIRETIDNINFEHLKHININKIYLDGMRNFKMSKEKLEVELNVDKVLRWNDYKRF